MNWAEIVFTGPRGVGKTTQLIEATKRLNGTLICYDGVQAEEIRREHGISTFACSIDIARLRGARLPLIFDTDAVARIFQEQERLSAKAIEAAVLEERDACLKAVQAIGCDIVNDPCPVCQAVDAIRARSTERKIK